MARKKDVKGDLGIPKPQKKVMSPDLDFSDELQTDFYTLNSLEKARVGKVKNLKNDLEIEKIKK